MVPGRWIYPWLAHHIENASVAANSVPLGEMITMVWRHTQGLWNSNPFTAPAWTPLIGWPLTWGSSSSDQPHRY